jgi:hypothetical protein
VASINEDDTIYVCDTINPYVLRTPDGNGFHYEWYLDGNAISNSDNDTLLITQGGTYHVVATDPNACTATSLPVLVIYSGPPALTINGLDTFYCVYHSQDTLTGLPIGGTFSGPGLSGPANRYFDPVSAGPGDHVITYTFTDFTSGCTNSVSDTVHVDLCTGIEGQDFIPRFALYPNPNQGSFVVEMYVQEEGALHFEVLDITGRTVHKETVYATHGLNRQSLEIPFLQNGIYNLKISGDRSSLTKHFVIG